MVAIVTGTGTGVENSSGWVLGSRGQLGNATFGRYGEGVYVNAANGNLSIDRTDEILIGEGPDSVISRNYNSLGNSTDDNGDNWRLSSQRLVTGLTGTVNTTGSTVTRVDWDGSSTVYTWDASRSAYVSTSGSGAYDTLTYASSTWTWTDGNSRTVETYDATNGGRITSSADSDGNALSYTYTGSLLTRVTTQDGEHTDLTWSGNNLTQIVTTLSGGATVTRARYTYDGSNRLSTVTTDLSPNDNSVSDGNTVVTTYTYDGSSKRVASISQTGGAYLAITYDGSNRVSTLTQTVASGDTSATSFTYHSGYTEITDANSQVTTLHYDGSGQLTEIDLPPAQSGGSSQVISYTYDTDGNVLTATDGSGNTTTYEYDGNGNLTQSLDEAGNKLTYTYDSHNQLLTQTQYLGGPAGNQAPLAINETVSVDYVGDSTTFDPRLNDSDPENDALTISSVSTPSHGTASIVGGGTGITYTRTSIGSDSFTYTISDGHGNTATATVTITEFIAGANQTPEADDDYTEVGGTGSITINPLSNDNDADGDTLTITAVDTPSYGTATIIDDGTAIQYTRTDAGDDYFGYTISDGHGNETYATVYVSDSGSGSNSAPTATNDAGATPLGVPTTFDPRYNDTDPDNDVLTIISVSTPTHGTATIVNDGTAIRYTHTISGTDSFTYTISDGNGHTSTATVIAAVGAGLLNLAPVPHNDTIAVSDGGSLIFDPRNNDYDVNVDTLTITAVSTPTYGTATIVNSGTEIEYTRSSSGTDSFTYTISDGNGHTGTATVTVTDPPSVNQPPFANNDNIIVNGIGDSAAFDPRLYDGDPEGDSLTIDWVSSASHGTVSVTGGGTGISYTRTSAGNDSFTYEISDGQGNNRTATVYVTGSTTVSSAPASDQVLTTRFVYDSENHLRFVVSPKGEVTEYDYNTAGRQTSAIVYRDSVYNISSLGPNDPIAESALSSWASGLSDKSTVERTDTTYDFRGNISTVTSYSAAATNGTGSTGQTYTVTTYTYDQYGNLLTRQTSGVANSEVYTYDGLGRLTSSTDLNGATTTFGFTDGSNTSTVTLASGLVQTSVYNDAGELISYQESGSGVSTATATYKYDDLGQLRISSDPLGNKTYHLYDNEGRKTADIASDGSLTVYGYDTSNRLVSTVTYVNKLNSTQLASLVDGSGNPVNVSLSSILPTATAADEWNWNIYDDANRLIETINGDGDATIFAYDGASNLTSTTVYANTLSVTGFKTTAPTTLQTPTADSSHDEVTRYFYDNDGRLIGTLDANGYLTQTTYNGAGETIETIAYATATYSGLRATGTLSQLLTSAGTSSQDRHVRYFYDDRGLLRYTLDATLVPTEYVYDNAGNLINTIAYAGSISSTSTYTLSYVQSQISSTLASNSSNRASWAIYDPNTGNLAYAIDANGGVTGYTYNSLGQVVKEVAYATLRSTTSSPSASTMNSWASSNSGSADRVTRLVYDQAGRVVYGVDAEGYVTEYRYNLDGQVYLQIRYPSQYTVTDGVTQSSLATLIGSIPSGAEQTSFTYDVDGRIASRTVGYGSSEAATTSYTYDGARNLTSATDARGNTSYSFYNSAGRVVLQIDADGYATATSYTSSGAIASVTHYATAVTGTITPLSPPTITTDSGADATTSFTYDKNNQVTAVTDAESHSESYTLDAFGDRVSVTNKLGGTTTNVFDNRGLLISETLPMNSVRSNGTTEASSVTNTFSYDAFGDRTQMVEASGLTEERTSGYTYDKLGRLTQTAHDDVDVVADDLETVSTITPAETVQYDAFGNVIETTDATGAHTFSYYDHLGRKTAQVDALGGLSAFAYDASGNVTSQKVYGDFVSLPGSAGGTPPSPVDAYNYRQTSYTYDHLNRLLTTTVSSLLTGEYDGSYATTTGNVTLTNYYDANGNVIAQTDGEGNNVWFYYDKNNRKIAEVDQNLYLTTYALDANGNVTTETRYATPISTAPSVPPGTTVPSGASDGTNDRVTTFTYDKNGNRLTETRTGVDAYSINASTGAITAPSSTATVTYTYNGLGEVTSKTEATGDETDYTYDSAGRQTSVQSPSYTDYLGNSVQNVMDEYYDGLNNLTRTVQEGNTSESTADRVTTFTYGAGGLASMTDASGFTRDYEYDADGRTVKVSYSRVLSDSSSVTEADATRYDALGRAVFQSVAAWDGTDWNFGDETEIQYNTYGEISARGVNGMWQEHFSYDSGGRMWRSTGSDGVVKLYVYDANGNQTLEIASDGTALPDGYDWSTLTLGDAIDLLTNSDSNAIGDAAVAGMVVTITVYDKRGQNVETVKPLRQTALDYDSETFEPGDYETTTITTSRVYNAFGEIVEQTDANGGVTDFTYNTEGKLTETQSPTVDYTDPEGLISSDRPTQYNYYDLSGRLIGTSDANNNPNVRILLAGTGYGGEDPLEGKEFHADSGVVADYYDVFGNLRKTVDALGNTEAFDYDAMGRLITDTHPTRAANSAGNTTGSAVTLVDHYTYDGLGQRLTHWNSEYGSSVKDTTDYDLQGRVVQTKDMDGHTVTNSYAWSSGLATTGLGTFGGWVDTIVNVSGDTESTSTDYFGHQVDKVDGGGIESVYEYDSAGRVHGLRILQGVEGIGYEYPELAEEYNVTVYPTYTYNYFNTGLMASEVYWQQPTVAWVTEYGRPLRDDHFTTNAYTYDANGNRTSETEYTAEFYQVDDESEVVTTRYMYSQALATYDAMNRMISYSAPAPYWPIPEVTWEYDLNGNVIHEHVEFTIPDGGVMGSPTVQDLWFSYDNMNRAYVVNGDFSGTRGAGDVYDGTTGQYVLYDLNGNRVETLDVASGATYYSYSADGYVGTVTIGSTVRAKYNYDAMGRVTSYSEYNSAGTSVVYSQLSSYDAAGLLNSTTTTTVRTDGTFVGIEAYGYLAETSVGSGVFTGKYLGGLVTHTSTSNTKNGVTQHGSDSATDYAWEDGQWQASQQRARPDVTLSANTTAYTYTDQGYLYEANITDGNPRYAVFEEDLDGHITRRFENDANSSGYWDELHFYFNGKELGHISTNGTSDVDYAQSIIDHTTVPGNGMFRDGGTTASPYTWYDTSYQAINGETYQPESSSYTVAAGDTLQSIAYQLWGDASFWYLIADANGLTASTTLVAGQALIIPNKVHNAHNSSDTYTVYNPNKIIGDLSPTVPKKPPPPKNHGSGCGIVGEVIMAVVAVALSFTGVGLVLGAVIMAATDAAIQGVAIATGMQTGFNWGELGMAAIGGAVSGGLAGAGLFDAIAGSVGGLGGAVLAGAVTGVANSVLTQGVGVALGLQKKFDWTGVAVAGISGGVGAGVGAEMRGAINAGDFNLGSSNLNTVAIGAVSGMASAIAGAATRSLVDGTDFGDNLLSALPGVVGATIGTAVGLDIQEGKLAAQYESDGMSSDLAKARATYEVTGDPTDWYGAKINNPSTSLAGAEQITVKDILYDDSMTSTQRLTAFQNLIKQMGGKIANLETMYDDNGNGALEWIYEMPDGRAVSYVDVYAAAGQNPDGTSNGHYHFFDTRSGLNDFLVNGVVDGQTEVPGGGLAHNWSEQVGVTTRPPDSFSTVFWAGATNSGQGAGALSRDFSFNGQTYAVSLTQAEYLLQSYYHEYSHSELNVGHTHADEETANWYGLWAIGKLPSNAPPVPSNFKMPGTFPAPSLGH